MNSSSIVLIVCLFGLVYGYKYEDCSKEGSKVGKLVSLDVSGCPGNTPKRCLLKRNTNITLEIGFTSDVDSDVVKSEVFGVLLGIPTPFALPNPDACKDSNVQCPIKSGQSYKYVAIMPVSSSYPKVTVDVEWHLKDKDGKDLVCVLIPSKIGS